MIFGDSNTKGLDPKKLNANVNSLSGATIDSMLSFMSTSLNTETTVRGVVFHLGSNNLIKDSTEDMEKKMNQLITDSHKKYPNAKIAICHLPNWNEADGQKIRKINTLLTENESIQFIQVTHYFQSDNKHYNQRGLAILAMNIKRWMSRNNLINYRYQAPGNATHYNNTFPAVQQQQTPWMNWPMPGLYNGNFPAMLKNFMQFPRS